MKHLILGLACSLLLATPATAAKPEPKGAAVDPHAAALVDMFGKSCIAYTGRLPQLKLWLDANMETANDKQTAYFTGVMSGKVWLHRGKDGNYAFVVYDMGVCTVKAEVAPVDDVAKYLIETAAPKLKLDIKQDSDSEDGNFMGMSGHVRTYNMKQQANTYLVVLAGTQKPGAPLQSQLSLALTGEP